MFAGVPESESSPRVPCEGIVYGELPLESVFVQVATFMFPPATLLTSIPVLSIVSGHRVASLVLRAPLRLSRVFSKKNVRCAQIVKYNLIEGEVCGRVAANLIAIALPWALALLFDAGTRDYGVMLREPGWSD